MELATIQQIIEVKEHPNADALELATVLGWQVVVKKGEFKAGDKVVYVGLDSILPEHPEFEFLAKQKYRIKTAKLRGEMSYGIVFSMDTFKRVAHNIAGYKDGQYVALVHNTTIGNDVTTAMGIKKYEKPVPKCQDAKGGFPVDIVKKTDEERLQNIPHILSELEDKEIYIAVKADGSSLTALKVDGEFTLCSRNMALKEPESRDQASNFWKACYDYNLQDIPDNTYVQAELIGEGIQKNPHGIKGIDIRVFNVGVARKGHLQEQMGLDAMTNFCKTHKLPMVDVIHRGDKNFETIEDLEKMADDVRYENGKRGEGIVIRLVDAENHNKMQKPLSFKVISPKYALKHDE